jgi:hypothetical protein
MWEGDGAGTLYYVFLTLLHTFGRDGFRTRIERALGVNRDDHFHMQGR